MVRVTSFGGFTVSDQEGRVVRFRTAKAGHLFLRLALAMPRGLQRHVLAEMFWPDRGEEQARTSLRRALSDVRAALGPGTIVTDADVVRCDPAAVSVDVLEAAALADAGGAADLELLAERVSGPLLPDFPADSDGFTSWLRDWRAETEAALFDALRRRLARLSDEGRTKAAEEAAEHLFRLDPTCEATARFLIEALARGGRRRDALARYGRLRSALADALDADPEPETAALVARLRLGMTEARAAPGEAPTPPPPEPAERNDTMTTTGPQLRSVAVVAAVPAPADEGAADEAYERRYYLAEEARAVLDRHGGMAILGSDGSLCGVFGAPVSYADDLGRARMAAAALSRLPDADAFGFGIAVGQILIDRSATAPVLSGIAMERAVDAARAAGPGEVRHHGSVTGVPGATETPARSGAFVGREIERAQISASLGAILRRGRGRVLILRGEPGIGKTRLADVTRREAEELGFRSIVTHVLDFGGQSGRDTIRKALRGLFLTGDEPADGLAESLAAVHGLDRSGHAILYDLLDLPMPQAARASLDAIPAQHRAALRLRIAADLFADAARASPLLAVFEDIHWADAGTLSGLAAVAGATRSAPLALVLTTRIEGDRLGAGWRAETGGAPVDTIDLAPFAEDEAEALAAAMGLARSASVRACIDRAGGNPLFLEQLLSQRRGTDQSAVPATIHSVVQARLDMMSERERTILQSASAFGQSFSAEALAELTGADGDELARIAEHGIIRAEADHYRFTHALVCDAVYASLVPSQRRSLHRAIAAWHEGRDEILVAEHLERAGDPRAPEAWLAAARSQSRDYRYIRTAQFARRGLAVAATADARGGLYLTLGHALHDLGDMAGAAEAFSAVIAEGSATDALVEAHIGLAGVQRMTDELPAAFANLDRAEVLAGPSAPPAIGSRISFLKGNLHFPRGEVEACRQRHERALDLAREAGDSELEAMALGGLGDAAYLAGRMRTAHEQLGACVAIAEASGLGRIAVANASQRCNASVFLLSPEEALPGFRETRALCRDVGNLRAELNCFAGMLWCLYDTGDHDACIVACDEAEDLVRRSGAPRYRQLTLLMRGRALNALGAQAEARTVLEEAGSFAAQSGMAFHGAEILLAKAEAAVSAAERDAALAEGEAIIAAGCVGHGPLRFYPAAARLMAMAGDTVRAARYATCARAFHPDERLRIVV